MSNFSLYVGDAVDLLRTQADASVDMICLDAAYESLEKHRAVGTTTRLKKSASSSNVWFPLFRNDRFEDLFREAFRVLKKNGHFYFFGDEETTDIVKPIGRAAGFKFWKTIIWAKTKKGHAPDADDLTVEDQTLLLGYHYRGSSERICFFEKGKRRLNNLGVRDVLPFPMIRGGWPTEKPVDLLKVLVSQSSSPGETVLDPFMGSGSTGVAAIRLGRNFIGGDIQDASAVEARKRLLAAGGIEQPGNVPANHGPNESLPLDGPPIDLVPPGKTLAEIFGPTPPADPGCSLDLLEPVAVAHISKHIDDSHVDAPPLDDDDLV